MPIYLNLRGVDGDRTDTYGTNGGVWKTTNFLTTDPNGPTYVPLISFGGHSVDARDPMATLKAVQLFNAARLDPRGTLYIATEGGVYRSAAAGISGRITSIAVDMDDPTWNAARQTYPNNLKQMGIGYHRAGSAETARRTNNLHQLGIGAHSFPAVEVLVANPGPTLARSFLLRNVRTTPAAPSSNGSGVPMLNLSMSFSKIDF